MAEASNFSSAQNNITFASEEEFAVRRTGGKEVFGSTADFLALLGTEEVGSRKTGMDDMTSSKTAFCSTRQDTMV